MSLAVLNFGVQVGKKADQSEVGVVGGLDSFHGSKDRSLVDHRPRLAAGVVVV